MIKTLDCNFRGLDLISGRAPVSICDCSKLFNLCLSISCTSNGDGQSWEFCAFHYLCDQITSKHLGCILCPKSKECYSYFANEEPRHSLFQAGLH